VAPPAQRTRPGRYLATFLGIVVVLYALVFLTGDRKPTPKLGIDLEGGTQVTLTARSADGKPPSKEQLVQARQIIDQRVNGLGVTGAEVVQDGNNLIITVPGDQGEKAKDLAQTAQLRIRPVLAGPFSATPPAPAGQAQPGQPQPGQSQSGQPQPQPGQQDSTKPTKAPGPGSSAPDRVFTVESSPPRTPHPTPSPHAESSQSASHHVSDRGAAQHQAAPPPPPAPPPAPSPGSGNTATDPDQVKQIALAQAQRQSLDPAVQQLALQNLQCTGNDVLRGYDDPAKPLVACDPTTSQKYLLGPTIIEGTQIASAGSGRDQQGAGYIVTLNFNAEGSRIWADFTTKNVNKQAAFVLDAAVVSSPNITEPILGGNTQIQGNFSQASAAQLAGILKYGSLPLSFATSDAQTVSATLGLASLQAGLIAGAIGLGLVFIYCLFYYRALGVLTILSLGLSGLVVYAVLVLLGRSLGFTLDLAGVAGFIVSIGITADSFVIYFERLKDEVREGRSFRAAVPRGWERARRTILSADAVSFLASAVLYLLAVGQVRGFAFTLGMSTILDLLVVFLVTHPLLILASRSRLFSSPTWSGMGAVARIGAMRRRAAAAKGA
jgi:preprotein translocase subunit SecD